MNRFSIKDIENLCGIKAHTLRTWEKRYGLVKPRRNGGNQRDYDNEDLKELLRVSFLYKQGYKISRIAEFSSEEVQRCVEGTPLFARNHELYVNQLIEAGLDFDKDRFDKIVNNLVICIGLERCISSVLYPCLEKIGLLWMTDHVIPAQEHFISHIIRKKIICATEALESPSPKGYKSMIFSPPGEFHEIPLLVANYLLRKNQRSTAYLGTDLGMDDVKYYAKNNPVELFFIHAVTHFDQSLLENYVHELCKIFPDKKVWISGPATACVRDKPANLGRIQSVKEMASFARSSHHFGIT